MKRGPSPLKSTPCVWTGALIAAALARVPASASPGVAWTDNERKQFYHLPESNAGHEYGNKRFDAKERKALLEYLKTLK